VQARDRFTERLREKLPSARVINAGVPGYGTDQEYLLLQRIWDSTKPDVVVLIFCTNNDHDDNSSNMRYGRYLKPYLERNPDGTKRFAGIPVPWSYHVYFNENRLVHNLWLARAAVTIYSYFFQAKLTVADPTENLIGMTRSFVESRGAKFLIGLQDHDPKLEAFLQAQGISFVTFDGAEVYPVDGNHWTPNGHALVADRLMSLFRAVNIPGPL
jgi:hypothetical protein